VLLSPYRVLDLTNERGQLAGQMLAQLGAEVIAIEPPAGSTSRRLAPFAHDVVGPENSLVHLAYNRGKKSVVLDLDANETDREAFRKLVAGADVVLDSAEPGRMAALMLGPAALAEINPALIFVSISAFGSDGPKAHWAATDLTVWASSGSQAVCGDEDRAPLPVGVPQAFAHAASEAAGAAIAALVERGVSGLGQHVDISAQQCSAQATQCAILAAPNEASTHQRISGGLKLGTTKIQLLWPCKDGFVSISFLFGTAIGPFSKRFVQWMFEEGYCDEATLGKDWIAYTGLLLSGAEPAEEYDRVKQIITDFCSTRTKAELLAAALERGLLIVPVLDVNEVVESEQSAARQYFDEIDGVRYPGQFGVLSKTPRVRLGAAPSLGAHTDSVLTAPPRALPKLPTPAPSSSDTTRGPALAGLKVLDLMWVMAGPAGSRVLADHGATVVRVESTTRIETARTLQPFRNDIAGPERSSLFASLNAGKLGIGIDIGSEAGREVILDLVRWADVVLESFSPRAMRNWGLDYESLRAINPNIVMMSSCLFGQTGPLSTLAGYGTMASALTGFTAITGWPDRAPCGPYGAYTDYISPRFASAMLLAAIDHQRRTGEGQYIDFAQAEGALHALAPAILDYSINGRVHVRAGTADPNHAPHGVYPAAGEQRWIAIACADDTQRAALVSLTGGLDDASISAWTALRDMDEATLLLQAAGVPAHSVQNSPECLADPQLVHLQHFVELPHSEMETVTVEAPRGRFSATPASVRFAAPTIGQHTYEVLTDILGYSDDRFSELLVSGALE
jgi:crotonobetainyl-CoA:carnitine CoA-transferase CaiB-like acyl-CoA transferase